MLLTTASNSLSATKQAFFVLYEQKRLPDDPKLWREEPALIIIRKGFGKKPVFFQLDQKNFKYLFNYRSYFPCISSKIIDAELDHWRKEFIESSRLEKLINYLQKNPLSKRAILNLWSDQCRDLNKGVPCLNYLFFRQKGKMLETHAHLRANNVLFLLLMDMQVLIGIQQIVADRLKLKQGTYIHYVDSLLFFRADLANIKKQYRFMKSSPKWKKI